MLERLFPQQADDKLFVEDVFSTYLYTGNGGTQTITNGIDLAGKGGMLWRKSRGFSGNHVILDTVRGIASYLESNTTSAAGTGYNWIASFNSDGFTNNNNSVNNGDSVSWTFRKAPKFFDVVTYTGNGSVRTIAHNLGVAPGMIFIKSSSETSYWIVYHRSVGATKYLILSLTQGEAAYNHYFNNTEPTASVFTLGNDQFDVNKIGTQYVAYLFAHDPSADGIIQCGGFATNSSGVASVNLGWEPQWVLFKTTDVADSWRLIDTMRGWDANGNWNGLRANTADAESPSSKFRPTSTGFEFIDDGYGGAYTFIYVAIRRGPMRTPTLGTSVFAPVLQSTQSPNTLRTVGFPADFILGTARGGGLNRLENTRLTGFANNSGGSINTPGMFTNATDAESNQYPLFYNVWNTTARDGDYLYFSNNVNWFFRRAPGFMDVVCYTGNYNGANAPLIPHNLGSKPELIIEKKRSGSSAFEWYVLSDVVAGAGVIRFGFLNNTSAFQDLNSGALAPTATGFPAFQGADPCVAYLFASVPGVSKVGTYTGNGSSQTINCAFTTGARFVMIKRTDSTGDWYVWDSARGIVAGNDPYLALNDIQAEVTNNDSVDPDSTGFVVNQVAASNINVNGASYIFLSIA